jgi:LPS-assembly protein
VTAAVTSRLIDPDTGAERVRATVGQRFYFDDQRVTLNQLGRAPVEVARTGRRADILGAFSGRVTASTTLDSAWQYNPRDSWTERFNFSVRYMPDFAKALNVSYRYSRDVLQDLDVSGQWPLGGRWYGVGRVTRSLKENRITETIAGIEYDGGCWVFRTAMHRFATNPDDVTQAIFLQLDLNGLASVGSSPVNLLKRSVAGYGKINEPVSDRVFGSY